MRNQLSKEWLTIYDQLNSEGKLETPINYDDIFNAEELFNKKLYRLPMGDFTFTTGHIFACDPVVNLGTLENLPYFRSVEPGTYPVETLVAELGPNDYGYVLTRVLFKSTKPVRYELALIGDEDLSELTGEESFVGFSVDSALATIVDVSTAEAYKKFENQWYQNNPNGNIYLDLLEEKFKQNALDNPKYQQPFGDWIIFEIPDTNLSFPMIRSGYGCGLYPVYWGIDRDGDICQIVVEYISCDTTNHQI